MAMKRRIVQFTATSMEDGLTITALSDDGQLYSFATEAGWFKFPELPQADYAGDAVLAQAQAMVEQLKGLLPGAHPDPRAGHLTDFECGIKGCGFVCQNMSEMAAHHGKAHG